MKHKFINIALSFFIILLSCDKYKETSKGCSNEILIVGNNNYQYFSFQKIDSLICHQDERCRPARCFEFDIEKDGMVDFTICSYWCYGGNFGGYDCYIETTTNNTMVIVNDSLSSPKMLNVSDTIKINDNTLSGYFDFRSCEGGETPDGQGYYECQGNWINNDMNYIGIVHSGSEFVYYCWLKVEMIECSSYYSGLYIYEIAILKGCLQD